jgi:hypothetical protein
MSHFIVLPNTLVTWISTQFIKLDIVVTILDLTVLEVASLTLNFCYFFINDKSGTKNGVKINNK